MARLQWFLATASVALPTATLGEIRQQRRTLSQEHERAAAERQSETRWKMVFQGLFFGAPIVIGVLYFLFFLNTGVFRWGPWGDVVGVVRIYGEIASNKLTSVDNIIPALEKAFLNTNVKAVVLELLPKCPDYFLIEAFPSLKL